MVRNLGVREGDVVLDLGTGTGIQAIFAAERAKRVVAIDINPYAVKCAQINTKVNGVDDKVDIRQGDLFKPVEGERFDIIIFNPPYIPRDPRGILESSWCCGENNQLIKRFLTKVKGFLRPGGRVQILFSTLGDINFFKEKAAEMGLKTKLMAEKRLLFEKVVILLLESSSN